MSHGHKPVITVGAMVTAEVCTSITMYLPSKLLAYQLHIVVVSNLGGKGGAYQLHIVVVSNLGGEGRGLPTSHCCCF